MLPALLEQGPAAVLFVAATALPAGDVEQASPDVLQERLGTVEPRGFRLLDLNDAAAAAARDPQHVPRNLPQLARLYRFARGPGVGLRVGKKRFPVFGGQIGPPVRGCVPEEPFCRP